MSLRDANAAMKRPPIAALALCCALLAGCGMRGPLYLPAHNGTVITRPGPTGGATPGGAPPGSAAPGSAAPTSTAPPQSGDTTAPDAGAKKDPQNTDDCEDGDGQPKR
jgi:hypothetical protein